MRIIRSRPVATVAAAVSNLASLLHATHQPELLIQIQNYKLTVGICDIRFQDVFADFSFLSRYDFPQMLYFQ